MCGLGGVIVGSFQNTGFPVSPLEGVHRGSRASEGLSKPQASKARALLGRDQGTGFRENMSLSRAEHSAGSF